MPKLLIPLLAALAVGGSTAGAGVYLATRGESAEEAPPAASVQPAATPTSMAATPAVKGQLWRWVNVTVVVPEGSDVIVARGTIPPYIKPDGGPGMELIINHDDASVSNIGIDAVTGEIVFDTVAQEDRAAIDEVRRTLSLSPFDSAGKSWPYQDELPAAAQRQNLGGMSYLVPDPASGVKVSEWIRDPGGPFINVSNGRSTILITQDTQTGILSQQAAALSPLDKASFDRYFSSVHLCGRDVKC